MYIETENFVPPGLYTPGIRYLTNKHKTEGRVYYFYKAAATKHPKLDGLIYNSKVKT